MHGQAQTWAVTCQVIVATARAERHQPKMTIGTQLANAGARHDQTVDGLNLRIAVRDQRGRRFSFGGRLENQQKRRSRQETRIPTGTGEVREIRISDLSKLDQVNFS